ncbi:hypothetical protein MAR_031372 [Mya arenaria]|uniref:Uncharacterized protein n=1 Tax=Mya arenaria TaxID=6604 RepID=A0ABY7F7W5_MYAAR|nr:hypothetical protein MAR_031372 [Mya arenaria]
MADMVKDAKTGAGRSVTDAKTSQVVFYVKTDTLGKLVKCNVQTVAKVEHAKGLMASLAKLDETVIILMVLAGVPNVIPNASARNAMQVFMGLYRGYWNMTCESKCIPECLTCSQNDGMCIKCKNGSKYGPHCSLDCKKTCNNSECDIQGDCKKTCNNSECDIQGDCKKTCNNSECDIQGDCTNGCLTNSFGKQCDNVCDSHCISKDMAIQDIVNKENNTTTLAAALGGGIGGGIAGLIIVSMLGFVWLRRRRLFRIERNELHLDAPMSEDQMNYETVDKNLRDIELNNLTYGNLRVSDVQTIHSTSDYVNVSKAKRDIRYENLKLGP